MSKLTKAYLAGFFDGEGSFGVYVARGYKHKDGDYRYYHYARATLGNTDSEIPYLLKEHFGGGVVLEHPPKGLTVYRWYASGKECAFLLKTIVPFLRQKQYRAKRLLEYYSKRKMLSWDEKEQIRLEFVALNGLSGKSHRPQRLNEKTP